MPFTTTKELTVIEIVAFASIEYKTDRFSSNGIAARLCGLLSETFKVRTLRVIDEALALAISQGFVETSAGPRGGLGYRVTDHGVRATQDVELPLQHFERRAALAAERTLEANANAAPVMLALLKALPENRYRERNFIGGLFDQWLNQGWLSQKQVEKLAETALQQGQYIEVRHFVGSALDEWRAPYIKQKAEIIAEQRLRAQTLALAKEAARKEKEAAQAETRKFNGAVKQKLKEMEQTGALAMLDSLVRAVFPNANLNSNAKAVAFAGHGSKELRVCIAALAFGAPPSTVWVSSGSIVQPDATSELWLTLTGHSSFQILTQKK